mgnify:CR=1 FL=1
MSEIAFLVWNKSGYRFRLKFGEGANCSIALSYLNLIQFLMLCVYLRDKIHSLLADEMGGR